MGNIRIVSASAGSGKTYNLAYEYVRNVIDDPSLYRHILAVTFTNKATEEMKRRILIKINELARGEEHEYIYRLSADLQIPESEITSRATTVRSYILHDYSHFSVVTIDKFFQRIIRSFIKELGAELNFNLELPVESLLGSAADRMIDDISTDSALREWIAAFVNDRIDDGRQWDIRKELLGLGSEVFKEDYKRRKGGKVTKELLKKVVGKASAEAEKAKAVITSTAKQILDVATSNNLEISDFSNGYKGVAGWVAKVASGDLSPYAKRVTDALETGCWSAAKSPKKAAIEAVAPHLTEILGHLVAAYDNGTDIINSATLLRENYRNFALLDDLRIKIAQVSKEENIVHISEINDMLSKLISGNDTPFVFEKAGNYYSHFMIDEFQDTSSMQWENFIPLLHNATSQSESAPVMLVGDVKQSIYRWRGGDWGILARRAELAFDGTEKTSLRNNFRSRRNVVGFINAVIKSCADAENSKINTALTAALAAGRIDRELFTELDGTVKEAYADCIQIPQEKKTGGYVTVTYYGENRDAETIPPVIEKVEELQRRGYRAGDIAILVRRNDEATRIATLLLDHKRANPDSAYRYDVVTQDALVIGRSPVVNFIIACFRLAINQSDSISRAIYNHYLEHGFGDNLSTDDEAFFVAARLTPPEECFENIVMRYRLGKTNTDISYIQALHEQILSFTKSNVADIPLFLRWWNDTGKGKSIPMPSDGNAIAIDTIHRSKGLGYKALIIPYCNWGLTTKTNSVIWSAASEGTPAAEAGMFPVRYKKAMGESHFSHDFYREYVMSQVDNLNLFYVALTRAMDELHIMMPTPGSRESEKVSVMLDSVIIRQGDEAAIGNQAAPEAYIRGHITPNSDGMVMEFGEPTIATESKPASTPHLPSYDTYDTAGRMAVRLSSQRYFEEDGTDGRLSPRNYGVLLHSLFEQSADINEISGKIDELTRNGIINAQEAVELQSRLNNALADETIRGWFDGSWETIRNEHAVLLPGGDTYRPDRVMTSGGTAIVIDYKFGLHESPKYAAQVRLYSSLLNEMGYTNVSGYVWYVSLGRYEKV